MSTRPRIAQNTTESVCLLEDHEFFSILLAAVDVIRSRIDDQPNFESDDSETPFDLEFLSDFDLKLGAEDVVYALGRNLKKGEDEYSISRADFITKIIDAVCLNFQLSRPKLYPKANRGIYSEIEKRVINSIIRKNWVKRDGKNLLIRKVRKGSLEW